MSWRVSDLEETALVGYGAVERHLAPTSKPIHLNLRDRPQQVLERAPEHRREAQNSSQLKQGDLRPRDERPPQRQVNLEEI